MRFARLSSIAGVALLFALRTELSEAQAPECANISATTQEDTPLELSLTCAEGGRLAGLEVAYIRTVVGNGLPGWAGDGGAATAASLNLPYGITIDRLGNLYIADSANHVIRRVDAATGIITTIAGAGVAGFDGDGGVATQALLNDPRWAVVDLQGNVFIADISNSRIRRVDAATGIIMTVVGGGAGGGVEGVAGTEAGLVALGGIAFDSAGDLFLVETGRNRIRRVLSGADGLVTGAADEFITTVAGIGIAGFSGDGGPALSAQFSSPQDLAFDLQGNLLVADSLNHRIRRVHSDGRIDGTADEIITTVAGGGAAAGDGVVATTIALNLPRGVTADRFGNIFISEAGALKIRRVDALTGIISTIVGGGSLLGEDILAATARTFNPRGVATDLDGNLFIAELGAYRIRAVRLAPPVLTYERVDPPANGLVTVSMGGMLTYTPRLNFFGEDHLTFRAVNTAGQQSAAAMLTITVTSVNDSPIADAGPNQTVDAGITARLDGRGSSDPDGTPITFSWRFTSVPQGSRAVLGNPISVSPSFVPDLSGVYVAELTVTDSIGTTAIDSVTLTARVRVVETALSVVLRYDPVGLEPGPPSQTGAAYWVEGALLNRDGAVVLDVGRIADTATVYGVPVGRYKMRLGYGAHGATGKLPYALPNVRFEPLEVSIEAGLVTTVTADLSNALGRLEGIVRLPAELTEPQEQRKVALPPPLALCVKSTEGRYATWCLDLALALSQGEPYFAINVLLPQGAGRGSVCPVAVVATWGLCEPVDGRGNPQPGAPTPLAVFGFEVRPGRTTSLEPINIVPQGIRVDLRYAGRDALPSQTGAAYWVEGALLDARGTVVMDVGRIADTATVYGVPVGNYTMRLGYGAHGATLIDQAGKAPYALTGVQPLDVRVEAGLVTTVRADLSDALGRLEGSVGLQVELTEPRELRWVSAPPPPLALCVKSTEGRYAMWCLDLARASSQGESYFAINVLLPRGAGRGSVCLAAVVAKWGLCEPVDARGNPQPGAPAPLAVFGFEVRPRSTTILEPINIVTQGVRVDLLYVDGEGLASPSQTGAPYWVEGALLNAAGTVVMDLGRIADTATVYGVPVGNYTMRLGYGAHGATLIDNRGKAPYALPDVRFEPLYVRVEAGLVTTVRADLSRALGRIEGRLSFLGEQRDPVPLALCVTSTEGRYATLCTDLALESSQGESYLPVNVLLPRGAGRGSVCLAAVVAEWGTCEPVDSKGIPLRGVPLPVAAFDFYVEPGATRGVMPR